MLDDLVPRERGVGADCYREAEPARVRSRRGPREAEITERGQHVGKAERAASVSDRFLVSIRSLTVAARQDEPFLRLTSLCNFRLTDLRRSRKTIWKDALMIDGHATVEADRRINLLKVELFDIIERHTLKNVQ